MFSEDKIEQTQSEKKRRKECLPVPSRTHVKFGDVSLAKLLQRKLDQEIPN